MTAYFTDPMGDEFKKALEEALKDSEEKGEDDPDALKRSSESKRARNKRTRKKRETKQHFTRDVAKSLR